MVHKNREGYRDPTAWTAITNVTKKRKKVANLIEKLRKTSELSGFELVGRIVLRDKETGKEYR